MLNKKRLIIITLAAVPVVVSVLYILSYYKKSQPEIPTNPASINTIIPGKTTEQEVLQNLGTPVASQGGILQYKSTSPAVNNEIVIKNNKVDFVKEIVSYKDTTTFNDLTKKYGEANYLYGPDAVGGYFLYYLPEKGIAYIANPTSGTVLEIWHFPVTTFDNFKNTWAKDYSTSPTKNQF
jgi:hypothetical protein